MYLDSYQPKHETTWDDEREAVIKNSQLLGRDIHKISVKYPNKRNYLPTYEGYGVYPFATKKKNKVIWMNEIRSLDEEFIELTNGVKIPTKLAVEFQGWSTSGVGYNQAIVIRKKHLR